MTRQEEQNDVLKDCAERPERLGIDYMLRGSMALIQYAVPRSTADIDIVIGLSVNDVDRFIEAFEPDYYVPHNGIRNAVYQNRMFNVLNQKVIFKVACVIRKNDAFGQEAFSRRKRVNYAGYFDVWIITKEV